MFLLTEGMKQEAVAMKQEDKQNHKDKILSDATDTASDGDELINITEAASTVVKDEVHMIDDINLPTNNTSDDTSKIYKDDPSSQNLSEFDNEERFKETKSKDKSDNKFKDEDEDSKLGNKRSLHSIDTVNTTKRPHYKISISPYMFQQNKKKKPHTHNNHSPHRHYPLFLLNSEPPHPQHLIMTKDKIISPYWNLHPRLVNIFSNHDKAQILQIFFKTWLLTQNVTFAFFGGAFFTFFMRTFVMIGLFTLYCEE